LSRATEVLFSLLEIIADHPQLFLIVLGVLAMLTGWAFGAGWIIALGFLFIVFGIITEKGRGEPARSPIH